MRLVRGLWGGLAGGCRLSIQLVIDGLGTRDVRLAHLSMKGFQVIEDQAAIDFHFDVTRSSKAAVIWQAHLFVNSNIQSEWHAVLPSIALTRVVICLH